jgi:sec-independent protein translocase protein TatA
VPNVGPTELLVVLIIALLVFGPKRLPEIGRTIGKSLREFRQASSDLRDEINRNLDVEGSSPSPAQPPAEPKPEPESQPKSQPEPQSGPAQTYRPEGPEANGQA